MDTTGQDPTPRRFNLGDAVVVIFGLALSLERLNSTGWFDRAAVDLAWCGETISQLAGWSAWKTPFATRRELMVQIASRLIDLVLVQLVCGVVVGLMVAQPLLRLRQPRPPRHQLIRQSGFVASVVSMWAVLLVFAIVGNRWYSNFVLALGFVRCIGAFLLWVVLGLPPWCTEASWIDRLGRAVGWGFIIAIAAQAVMDTLRPL
jgi:hypothetical protein